MGVVTSLSNRPPHAVTLKIKVWRGWCGAAGVMLTTKFRDGQFSIDEKVFRPRPRILCKLDFEYIERYEKKTLRAIESAQSQGIIGHTEIRHIEMSDIESYIHNRYGSVGVVVTITGQSDNHLSIVLRQLRGEVILGKKHWEKLQIFILIAEMDDSRRTHLIIDGQYASGFLQPPDSAYLDMEPRFSGQLQEYGSALLISMMKEAVDD